MDPRYSNYPRANVQSFGSRPPGAYFESISEAFNIIRADFGTWIVVSLLTIIVSYAVSLPLAFLGAAVLGGQRGAFGAGSAGFTVLGLGYQIFTNALTYAVTMLFLVGQGMMGLRASRGERPEIGDLFAPFRMFVPVFLTGLVVSFAVMVGLVFLIIPGIILAGLLVLAPFAAFDQNLQPGDALRWSVEKSKPYLWNIAWIGFCASFVSGLGVIACCVGYLVTAPIFGIFLGLTYGTFQNPAAAPAPFMPYPPSGPVVPSSESPAPPSEPPTPGL